MRALAFALVVLALVNFARAGDAPDVQGIISRQLDAFAHDDAASAYAFAAPGIQEKFPSADAFLAMVKETYPPVYRHRSVQYGKQSREGDQIEQGVVFVDPDNVVWGGVYTLGQQADGGWKITGCVIVR
jgi:hypothetical protein